jgi:hypothetical protein
MEIQREDITCTIDAQGGLQVSTPDFRSFYRLEIGIAKAELQLCKSFIQLFEVYFKTAPVLS